MNGGAAGALGWLGLGLGLVGLGAGLAGPRRAAPAPGSGLWARVLLGGAAALLAGLLTLGREYPFEPGQRLGWGVLLGALAGLLYVAVVAVGRARPAALAIAGQGAALAGASAALLLHPGYPQAVLAGVPVGMGLLLWFVLATADEQEQAEAARAGGTTGVLAAAVLAAAVALAIERYAGLPRAAQVAAAGKAWWAFPLAAAGAALLGQVGAALLPRRAAIAVAAAGLLTFGTLVILVSLLRGAAPTQASAWSAYGWLLLPLAAGWVSALVLAAVVGGGPTGEIQSPAAPVLALVVLLVLLGAAYRLPAGPADGAAPTLGGFGLCLAALGFLGGAPWFRGGSDPEPVPATAGSRFFLAAAGLLTLASLFRLFYIRYELDESGIRLAAHYVLLGLLGGAGLPLALGIAARAVPGGSLARDAARGLLLGAAALIAPALLVVFFGIRAGGGVIVGLTAGMGLVAFLILLEPAPEDGRAGRLAAAVPVVPVLFSALFLLLALTPLDFYVTHWPRAIRIGLATLLALALAAWALRAQRQQPAGP